MVAIIPPQISPTGFVYVFRCQQYFKIGQAIDIRDRLRNVQTNNPFLVTIVKAIQTSNMSLVEGFLHKKFRMYRERGEWFQLPAEAVDWLMKFDGLDLRPTPDMIDELLITPEEIDFISVRLGRGMSASDVAKSLPGYSARKYKEYREKVQKVEASLVNFEPDSAAQEVL